LPNNEIQNSSFFCTTAFSAQQLSLHSQPQTAQTNRPLKLLEKFKGISRCNIGDGKTTYLWTDLWSDNCLSQKLPHLASFAKKMDITVHESIHTEFLEDLFHLPLSQEAYSEFQDLETLCEATQERIN
jgi:hypothetical protein